MNFFKLTNRVIHYSGRWQFSRCTAHGFRSWTIALRIGRNLYVVQS